MFTPVARRIFGAPRKLGTPAPGIVRTTKVSLDLYINVLHAVCSVFHVKKNTMNNISTVNPNELVKNTSVFPLICPFQIFFSKCWLWLIFNSVVNLSNVWGEVVWLLVRFPNRPCCREVKILNRLAGCIFFVFLGIK